MKTICLWCGKSHKKSPTKCKLLSKRASEVTKAGVPVWCLFGALDTFGHALLLEPEHFNARMELFAERFGKKKPKKA